MLDINIKIKSMSVEEYDPKTGAKIKIVFNDGLKDRVFMKSFAGGKVEELGESILKDIRDFENEQNPTDSEDPFDRVNIRFDNEDKVEGYVKHFFEKVAGEIKFITGHGEGSSFLSAVNKLRNLKTEFK